MIPIYVCEDNEQERTRVTALIRNFIMIEGLDMKLELASSQPEQILEAVAKNKTRGIYFLDVDLSHALSGFDLAQEIRRLDARGFITFITTHGEMAFETFKYQIEAMDYILKDEPERIGERIFQCLRNIHERMNADDRNEAEYFTIRHLDQVKYIRIEDILYFETSAVKHKLIVTTSRSQFEFFDNLKNIEQKLGDSFIRCHRSFLINKQQIKTLHSKESFIVMADNKKCLLSRDGKKRMSELSL